MNNKNLAVFEIYFVAKVNDKVGTIKNKVFVCSEIYGF